jgi:hypothetical protein
MAAQGRGHATCRTSNQQELDLVLDLGQELWACEVKLTASPSAADMERLNKTADLIGASRRFLVSRTSKTVEAGERVSCNLDWLVGYLERQST